MTACQGAVCSLNSTSARNESTCTRGRRAGSRGGRRRRARRRELIGFVEPRLELRALLRVRRQMGLDLGMARDEQLQVGPRERRERRLAHRGIEHGRVARAAVVLRPRHVGVEGDGPRRGCGWPGRCRRARARHGRILAWAGAPVWCSVGGGALEGPHPDAASASASSTETSVVRAHAERTRNENRPHGKSSLRGSAPVPPAAGPDASQRRHVAAQQGLLAPI